MKRVVILAVFALLSTTVSTGLCQPPGGFGPGFEPPPNPVLETLDVDGDHEISAQEIQTAAASLTKLDKNSDGKLALDELHPAIHGGRSGFARPGRPQQRRMRGPAGRGPSGPAEGRDHNSAAGPPSPEQFVENALRFDADEDGKLSKDELAKLAEQFMRRPPSAGRPGERESRPDDARPARPQRPASE